MTLTELSQSYAPLHTKPCDQFTEQDMVLSFAYHLVCEGWTIFESPYSNGWSMDFGQHRLSFPHDGKLKEQVFTLINSLNVPIIK
jgi:hypothetical protein